MHQYVLKWVKPSTAEGPAAYLFQIALGVLFLWWVVADGYRWWIAALIATVVVADLYSLWPDGAREAWTFYRVKEQLYLRTPGGEVLITSYRYWWSYGHGWPVNAVEPMPTESEGIPAKTKMVNSKARGPANTNELYVECTLEDESRFILRQELGQWSSGAPHWPYRSERYQDDTYVYTALKLQQLVDQFLEPHQAVAIRE